MTQQSGWGPDSSLIMAWILTCPFYCLAGIHPVPPNIDESVHEMLQHKV